MIQHTGWRCHMEEIVDELFPTTPAAVRAILDEIRRTVRDTLPDATEIFYHGALGYGPTASGFDRILYVMPQNGYANLGFFFGTDGPDPTGLLEGTGKRMRHVKISDRSSRRRTLRSFPWSGQRGSVGVLALPKATRRARSAMR